MELAKNQKLDMELTKNRKLDIELAKIYVYTHFFDST